MISSEREQLQRFLNQMRDAHVPDKDLEAESLIREAVAQQPDAAYLLVQRAMLVEQALNNAKARISELQRQRPAALPQSESGFLGGRNPWAVAGEASGAPVPGAGSYRVPASGSAPAAGPMMSGGGGGSFLGNVASTAAGVVAGSFLFQGIESLLGHHHGAGSSWMDPNGEHLSEQTVINNYYGDEADERDFDQLSENEDGIVDASDSDDGYLDDSGDDSSWV